jgi:hypothetical protein
MPTKKPTKKARVRKSSAAMSPKRTSQAKSLTSQITSQEKAMTEVVAAMFAIAAVVILLYIAKIGF